MFEYVLLVFVESIHVHSVRFIERVDAAESFDFFAVVRSAYLRIKSAQYVVQELKHVRLV